MAEGSTPGQSGLQNTYVDPSAAKEAAYRDYLRNPPFFDPSAPWGRTSDGRPLPPSRASKADIAHWLRSQGTEGTHGGVDRFENSFLIRMRELSGFSPVGKTATKVSSARGHIVAPGKGTSKFIIPRKRTSRGDPSRKTFVGGVSLATPNTGTAGLQI